MVEPDTKTRVSKTYGISHAEGLFHVDYVKRTYNSGTGEGTLDEQVKLYKVILSDHKTPERSNTRRNPQHWKSTRHLLRLVIQAGTSNEGFEGMRYAEIHQFGSIPNGLDELIDNEVPESVVKILRREYSDPSVIPYNFGYEIE